MHIDFVNEVYCAIRVAGTEEKAVYLKKKELGKERKVCVFLSPRFHRSPYVLNISLFQALGWLGTSE